MADRKKSEEGPPDADQDRQKSFSRRPYQHKSLEELVDMLDAIVFELKLRMGEITVVISDIPKPEFPGEVVASDATHFVRLPPSTSNLLPEDDAIAWRIVLRSSEHGHKPLNLEIYDDIVIGRKQEYTVPDLDLTEYDALALGVSRQHAQLHPTEEGLEIADLGSSNGTYVNEVRLEKDEHRMLQDGDVLSFGLLHFKLTMVGQPPSPQAGKEAKP